MEIKVLGTGCSKCNVLFDRTKQAIQETGNSTEIEKIEDIQKIMSFGVMSLPALVIDGKVVMYGKVPSVEYIKKLIN